MQKVNGLKLQYIIWGLSLSVFGVSLSFGYYLYYTTEREMAAQFNTQQLILAQEASTGIEEYLGSLRRNMQVLKYLNTEDHYLYQKVAHTIYQKFKDTALTDVWMVNSDGILEASASQQQLIGQNVSDEFYFVKAKKSAANQIYTSGIFKLGKRAASMHNNKWIILSLRLTAENTPPQKDHFLIFLISVNKIINKFVLSIRSGKTGYAWVLDDNGTLLHHPKHPEMIDRSIFAADEGCVTCHYQAFSLEKEIVRQTISGKNQFISATGVRKLIAYSPIHLGNRVWTIVVAAPYTEVTLLLRESFYQLVGLLAVIGFTMFTVAVFVLRINKQRLAAESKATYTHQLEKEVAERTYEFKQEKQKLDDIVSAIGAQLSVINKDMRIIWGNNKVKEEFGEKELLKNPCYKVYYRRNEPCPKCPAARTFGDGQVHQIERLNKTEKSKAYYQITTTPIYGASGEIEQVLELTQDITLEKHQEQNLIDSKKMFAVGQIAIGLAHDLGNPLGIIAGSTQFCLKNLKPAEEIKKHLEVIGRNANASSKVIKALLQFARPSEDSVFVEINLPEILQRTFLLLSAEFSKKQIKVINNCPQALPPVFGDKGPLEQVFVNVLLNSIEALPPGGEITFSVEVDRELRQVCLSFADNGPGISSENLENVFEPFFTTRVRGVGLGLSISKRTIETHHGTIQAENQATGGAKITICLPFASRIKKEYKI